MLMIWGFSIKHIVSRTCSHTALSNWNKYTQSQTSASLTSRKYVLINVILNLDQSVFCSIKE